MSLPGTSPVASDQNPGGLQPAGQAEVTGQPSGQSDPNGEAELQPTGRTPEEVDAYWRNRVSKKDKAHAAAERTLREQITSLEERLRVTPPSSGQPGTGGDGNANAAINAQIAELERKLEAERQGRVIDQRKAKYSALAAQVGNADGVFASADEATLAKLNELADDGGGSLIAPTSPGRGATPTRKPLKDMTAKELEDQLRVAVSQDQQLRQLGG